MSNVNRPRENRSMAKCLGNNVIFLEFFFLFLVFFDDMRFNGKFFMLFCQLLICFYIIFPNKDIAFRNFHQSCKQFGSRSGPTFCRA